MKTKIFTTLELSQISLFLSKGDLPMKFHYKTPKGAAAWMKWENSEESGGCANYESALLLKNEDIYLQELNNAQDEEIVIFDFGTGEGKSIENFLKKLSVGKKVFYHAFDISEFVLESNKKRITKISNNITYGSTLIDFESGNFFEVVSEAKLRYGNKNILAFLLGNTVGNFLSIESILEKVLEPLSKQDRLVVGIGRSELSNKIWIDNLVTSYRDEKAKNIVFSVLDYLGVDTEMLDYDAEFDMHESAVNAIAICKENITLKINEDILNFNKGQRIRVAKSQKVDEASISKTFSDLNLRVCNLSTTNDDKYMQVCLSNKSFC